MAAEAEAGAGAGAGELPGLREVSSALALPLAPPADLARGREGEGGAGAAIVVSAGDSIARKSMKGTVDGKRQTDRQTDPC